MTVLVSTVAVPLAVALFAVSTALHHGIVRSAAAAPKGTGLAAFISGTLSPLEGRLGGRHPWPRTHAVALRDGPLTLLQPLLVSSVHSALC